MRRLITTASALVALIGLASPAWAHEEITPSSIATGKPVFFTLSAANEAKADLTKLTLNAPDSLAFGATTKAPAGWTVDRSDRVITWTGGAVNPDRFDQWGFEIDGADQPGTLTYHLSMNFADGTANQVDVPITVTAETAGTARPAGSANAASTGGNGRDNTALGLGVIALIAACSALGLVLVRRRTSPGSTSGGGAGKTATDAQDW